MSTESQRAAARLMRSPGETRAEPSRDTQGRVVMVCNNGRDTVVTLAGRLPYCVVKQELVKWWVYGGWFLAVALRWNQNEHRKQQRGFSMRQASSRSHASFAAIWLWLWLCLLVPVAAQAQFVVVEGKGYTLCERIAAHVNRLTENGKAKRLWRSHKEPGGARYPDRQSHLTRELLSFPGFTRPAFTEIKLEDIRSLIELMGEVDALWMNAYAPHYAGDDIGVPRYVADRKAGLVPSEVLEKVKPYGLGLYNMLAQRRALVFKLSSIESLVPETILQIEYAFEATGEPVSLLRHVSNDLSEPRKRASFGLDSQFVSRALVQWKDAYYTIVDDKVTFEVQSRSPAMNPYLCRVHNHFQPREPQPNPPRK